MTDKKDSFSGKFRINFIHSSFHPELLNFEVAFYIYYDKIKFLLNREEKIKEFIKNVVIKIDPLERNDEERFGILLKRRESFGVIRYDKEYLILVHFSCPYLSFQKLNEQFLIVKADRDVRDSIDVINNTSSHLPSERIGEIIKILHQDEFYPLQNTHDINNFKKEKNFIRKSSFSSPSKFRNENRRPEINSSLNDKYSSINSASISNMISEIEDLKQKLDESQNRNRDIEKNTESLKAQIKSISENLNAEISKKNQNIEKTKILIETYQGIITKLKEKNTEEKNFTPKNFVIDLSKESEVKKNNRNIFPDEKLKLIISNSFEILSSNVTYLDDFIIQETNEKSKDIEINKNDNYDIRLKCIRCLSDDKVIAYMACGHVNYCKPCFKYINSKNISKENKLITNMKKKICCPQCMRQSDSAFSIISL